MKLFLLLWVMIALPALAQTEFHATSGTEDLLEGGRVERLTVVWSNYQFNIRPPKAWTRQLDDTARELIFTSPSGKSAITVRFTTNSPGSLRPEEELKAWAVAEHAGASYLVSSVCPTSYQPGISFDLVRVPAPGVVQKIRHAFAASPTGEVEISLTASEDEFKKNCRVFMGTARAFRVERVRPKTP